MNRRQHAPLRRALSIAITAFALGATLGSALPATAQDKPVLNIIVPYAAGGPSDANARRLVPELQKALGQTVVVQNIPGAGGAIAAQKVAQAPADGLTLMYASPNEVILVPSMNPNAKYKAQDFTPVGIATRTPMLIVTRTGLPVNNVDELIQHGKTAGRELSYGSVGPGSFQHILGAYLAEQTQLKMIHVPYKGSAPLNTDIIGQQVDLMVTPLSGVRTLVEGGKVRALAMMTRERVALLKDIPTTNESQSLKAKNMDFWLWGGLVAPAATPPAALARLHDAFNKVIQMPNVREGIAAAGGEPQEPRSLVELQRQYQSDAERYRELVKKLNIRIDN